MNKKKILFLNLPGKEKYLREYFCSKVSKARYYYPPLNLVYLTWRFDNDKYNLYVIDAIAKNLSIDETLNKIETIKPDIVYFLASAPSFKEDKIFIWKLRNLLPNAKLIWDWDVFRELKEESFTIVPELDAINYNFWSWNIVKYVEWKLKWEENDNIIYKYNWNLIVWKENFKTKIRDVPVPRRDLFDKNDYNHPFAIKEKSITMLTDFWCAFRCSFCPLSNIDWSLRPMEVVIKELKQLKSQWINDIFFMDQTFWVDKERSKILCDEIKKIWISRCAFSRVDVVNEDLIKKMSETWCYEILFGIESANEEILKKYNKNTKQNSMINAINLCKKYHIKACWTFIIWLPWDSKESIKNTIKFAKILKLDYASFNIATPRIWTNFRSDMINQWRADPKDLNLESAKQKESSRKKHELTHKEIMELHSYAIRTFYLDPIYLLRRLFSIKSFVEFKNLVLEWFCVLFKK